MNCLRGEVSAPLKKESSIEFQIIRGIFQFRRKSRFDDSNGDISPVFAWRFWRKFLAMGSTGNGAALGRFQFSEFTPLKYRLRLCHNGACLDGLKLTAWLSRS